VFGRWVKPRERHHPTGPKPRLDQRRRKAIHERLAEGWDVDTLCLAVEGIWMAAWNLGQNDRGTEYTDITVALKNSQNIEKFSELAMARRPAIVRAITPETPTAKPEALR